MQLFEKWSSSRKYDFMLEFLSISFRMWPPQFNNFVTLIIVSMAWGYCSISSALAMEIQQFCTNPSIHFGSKYYKLSKYIQMNQHIFLLSHNSGYQGFCLNTVKCRYNSVQFIAILNTVLLWQQQSIESNVKVMTYTPYLTLTGDLWGVCCGKIGENWPRYNSTALYHQMMSFKMADEISWNFVTLLKKYNSIILVIGYIRNLQKCIVNVILL